MGIYVMGSSETEDDESDDEQVDIGEVRTSKLEELFADEIKEYERRRKRFLTIKMHNSFHYGKNAISPIMVKKLGRIVDEDDEFMRKRDVYLQRLSDDDARVVNTNKGWNPASLDSDSKSNAYGCIESLQLCRDVAVISACDESISKRFYQCKSNWMNWRTGRNRKNQEVHQQRVFDV